MTPTRSDSPDDTGRGRTPARARRASEAEPRQIQRKPVGARASGGRISTRGHIAADRPNGLGLDTTTCL
ncbi:hypothetical protein J6590_030047 [Homalodisca vitripennis]|nr:hypothetical protein J6590_030047 [Homalodisca vitripennis]